ncbi:uncharacterized protein LOC103706536 [Phoenix dactylifera]|uniref:Uncharacterized protein LOC103706536 n=1 Tax=Phoenix dactylifera TaxID=42345 RepID=A0A8B9ACF6_PHODC|nr:uncharacterized protein LOC103706536 [Phoenix dactylifera]
MYNINGLSEEETMMTALEGKWYQEVFDIQTKLLRRSIPVWNELGVPIPRSWGTYAVDSRGLSGGIIVLWRLGGVGIDVFHKCNQQVILVISEGVGPPWVLLATYASTNYRERRVLWEEATNLIQLGHPVMMAGDFNCIDSPEDKRGGKVFSNNIEVREFQDFIQSNGLADLGFTGPRFTWCNNRLGMARVWERIDRVYATPGWIQRFPDFWVRHLPRIASDHCPVLVWLSYPRSWEVVREAWQMPVRGDVMYRVTRKLELTRRQLQRWNKEKVGNIFRRVEETEASITRLQALEDRGGGLSEGGSGGA